MWCIGLLGAGCSTGDINNASPFGDSQTVPDSSGGDSSTGGNLTTGVSANATGPSGSTGDSSDETDSDDPSAGEESSGSSADSTSSGGDATTGMDESSTTSTIECGDGMAEGTEACDGDDLADMTCIDVGDFVGGTLACDAACAFDTSGCMEMAAKPVEVCADIALAIPDNSGAVSSTVTLPEGGTVADATTSVTLNHTFIGDLTIDLGHDGTTVRLYNRECGSQDNLDLDFDDAGGAAIDCDAATSGIATMPTEALSAFDGADAGGVWTFSFQDNAGIDTGTVTQICVTVSF